MLTTKQAAGKLGVHDSRVRQVILEGKLKATKFGNAWVIDEQDLLTYQGATTMKKSILTIIDSIDHHNATFYARTIEADAASGELVLQGHATNGEIVDAANSEMAAPPDGLDYSGYDVVWTNVVESPSPEIKPTERKIYLSAYTGYRHNRYDGFNCSWGVLMALGASRTADAFADEDDYPDEVFQIAYDGENEAIGKGYNDQFRSDVLGNLDDDDINAVKELEVGETAKFSQYWGQYKIEISVTLTADKRLLCVFDGYGPFEVFM
jgi:excisionase family DNA binding protein